MPPPSSHTTGRAVPHPAVPASRFRGELRSVDYSPVGLLDTPPVIGTSGSSPRRKPSCEASIRPTERWPSVRSLAGSALRQICVRLLWPLLTSDRPSRRLSTPVAQGRPSDLPGYCAHTFTLMSVGFTSARSVQVSGFDDIGRLTPRRRLVSASCSSNQRFAYSFLQIPSRPGHPCRSANTSPCRACRGLAPPSICAMPGAP